MAAKQLAYSDEARQKLLAGVSKLARAVRCTLGPRRPFRLPPHRSVRREHHEAPMAVGDGHTRRVGPRRTDGRGPGRAPSPANGGLSGT